MSDGAFDLPEGTVYPALHRLEKSGLVSSLWGDVGGRRRRVYHLTGAGAVALSEQRNAWRHFSTSVDTVLGGCTA